MLPEALCTWVVSLYVHVYDCTCVLVWGILWLVCRWLSVNFFIINTCCRYVSYSWRWVFSDEVIVVLCRFTFKQSAFLWRRRPSCSRLWIRVRNLPNLDKVVTGHCLAVSVNALDRAVGPSCIGIELFESYQCYSKNSRWFFPLKCEWQSPDF